MDKDIQALSSVLFLARVPMANAGAARYNSDRSKKYKELAAIPETDPELTVNLVAFDFEGDLPENSIAFHPIYGTVRYDYSWWHFSTKQFMDDLKAAEENPNIVAHLIHVDSNGGEAFGCHEAFEAVKALKKPCIAVIDSMAASAGYYLCCAADKVYAGSMFSDIGCIGTMCIMENDSEYWQKHGIKEIELYSNYSPLKNKVIKDALDGNGDDYVKRFLDPLALRFIEDVKSVRTSVQEDSDAVKGEIFYAAEAMAQGLVDGNLPLADAVQELISMIPAPKHEPSIDINSINI